MWLLLLQQTLCVSLSLATLTVLLWAVREYIRARWQIQHLLCTLLCTTGTKPPSMQMDDLIDELLADDTTRAVDGDASSATKQPEPADSASTAQRERLATIAAGGQARQYLGKAWTVEEIDSLGEDEVGKLYARYEARLGAAMTKTLGRAALQMYTAVVSMFLPIPPENRQLLMADLESDPFVGHALNSGACELYYRYGKFLAPITAALTTAKYCQFGHQRPVGHIEMEDNPDSNVMTTPTPETPVLRVTDPGPKTTETTPTTSQSPRQKDPKKVAAGRAGAAARKAKQARLLEELREKPKRLAGTRRTLRVPHQTERSRRLRCSPCS